MLCHTPITTTDQFLPVLVPPVRGVADCSPRVLRGNVAQRLVPGCCWNCPPHPPHTPTHTHSPFPARWRSVLFGRCCLLTRMFRVSRCPVLLMGMTPSVNPPYCALSTYCTYPHIVHTVLTPYSHRTNTPTHPHTLTGFDHSLQK